ncbi:MAG: ribonuclease P protein component [Patescibacteria group bacterium]
MLPRIHRLSSTEDWRRVHAAGSTVHGRGIVVKVLRSRNAATRFGFSISTKVSKRATVRNRIKRQLRVAAGKYVDSVRSGLDVVFIARTPLVGLSSENMEHEVVQVLKKARVLL